MTGPTRARSASAFAGVVAAAALVVATAHGQATEPAERIAFESTRGANTDVFAMNADGSGETRLTSAAGRDGNPSWEPPRAGAGQRIAFESDRDGHLDIYVMNSDGSGVRRLTSNDVPDSAGAWSPDGTLIAFASGRDTDTSIHVIAPDGSGEREVTSGPDDRSPAWSPDGSSLAFESRGDLWTVRGDGTGRRRLTDTAASESQPAWFQFGIGADPSTPNDDLIVYSRSDPLAAGEIFVTPVRGGAPATISASGHEDVAPAWSGSGRRIAFASDRDGNFEIYAMQADGRLQQRLTMNQAPDMNPDWSGAPIREPIPTPSPAVMRSQGCTKHGNDKANRILGTSGNDRICGLGGNDRIFGLGGNDVISGGEGRDIIDGGKGNDTIFDEDGDVDTVIGGPGKDFGYLDRTDHRRSLEGWQ
jgi:Ca2+-binding RTX toxin-like protein